MTQIKQNFKSIKIFIFLIVGIFLLSFCLNFVSSEEINYSVNYLYEGIQISSLKYEPYPVNPGDYFDVWLKVKIGSSIKYARFEIVEEYPFSLDDNEEAIREYQDVSGDLVLHYKVRVDKNAVESENPLKIKIASNKFSNSSTIYELGINIANAQTNFDLVVQDSTSSDISLAIANIGKNTANSMIVRIPDQDSFKLTGTNGQMVGNLDAGDYTIVNFNLISSGRNNDPLIVQIDYTDNIGERRSVLKEIALNAQSIVNTNDSMGFRGIPGDTQFRSFPGQKKAPNWTYFLAGFLFLVFIGIFIYFKYTKKVKNLFKKAIKETKETSSEIPEWIKKVKEREIKFSHKK